MIIILIYLSCTLVLIVSIFVIKRQFKERMGNFITYMWWGGNPDVVNPDSGLSRRDIYHVQKSWQLVYSDPVQNGTELLRRLFEAYPNTKNYFKIIKGLPEAEYLTQPQFKAHVMNLMNSLNTAVTNLNKPEIVAALMNKLGESHGKRNIQKQDFNDLTNVIVKMYIEVLHLNETTLISWGKVVAFWYKNIFETLEQQTNTSS